MRSEGIEPPPCELKVRCATDYTTTSLAGRAYLFQSLLDNRHLVFPLGSRLLRLVVALRIELSATRLSAAPGPPALDYLFKSGTSESNRPVYWATGLLPPNQACCHLHLCPIDCQSERQDLNLRPPGPRPGAMPNFATSCFQYPVRELNPSHRLERAVSSTDRPTGHVVRVRSAQVGREALESSSPVFQTDAMPSQLPAQIVKLHEKRPGAMRHRAFSRAKTDVTCAKDHTGVDSWLAPRYPYGNCVRVLI